ncbi:MULTISPECIES: type II toxin-antitoxin system YafQ family toxin [Helicobacter]|uniref:YafQ family addiction module toxin component n=1 Tax=Helicobacter bilis ATCC 43879 TaxID=613026 RepID=C3XFM1_9HELI|nr:MULTISPECIES: type II toxin-antitoxin system YafQ family toxin [Helicobacter]EEO23810.2 YafQ family addiction module toxin component [Helicobacter bilis ATCC 43879]
MAKYTILYHRKFVKDYEKLSNNDRLLVDEVIEKLANGEILDQKYKDHKLKGNLKDFRECHVKPDLLLMYEIQENILHLNLMRVGSHSDLFKK